MFWIGFEPAEQFNGGLFEYVMVKLNASKFDGVKKIRNIVFRLFAFIFRLG